MYICFEGSDSAGKTSSCARIAEWLEDHLPKDIAVHRFHQPGDTNLGQAVRALVKDPDNKMTKLGQFYGMCLDHAQFCDEKLKDILTSDKDPATYIILQDRHSAISGWITNVRRYETVTPEQFKVAYDTIHDKYPFSYPDIALVLTLPSEQIIENLKKRGFTKSNRFEASHDKEDWDKVVKAYEDVPSEGLIPSDRYITLDGDKKRTVLIANQVEAILAHKNMVEGPIKEQLRALYKSLLDEIADKGINKEAKKDEGMPHFVLNPSQSKKIDTPADK